jgi:hypothetical protein
MKRKRTTDFRRDTDEKIGRERKILWGQLAL